MELIISGQRRTALCFVSIWIPLLCLRCLCNKKLVPGGNTRINMRTSKSTIIIVPFIIVFIIITFLAFLIVFYFPIRIYTPRLSLKLQLFKRNEKIQHVSPTYSAQTPICLGRRLSLGLSYICFFFSFLFSVFLHLRISLQYGFLFPNRPPPSLSTICFYFKILSIWHSICMIYPFSFFLINFLVDGLDV